MLLGLLPVAQGVLHEAWEWWAVWDPVPPVSPQQWEDQQPPLCWGRSILTPPQHLHGLRLDSITHGLASGRGSTGLLLC